MRLRSKRDCIHLYHEHLILKNIFKAILTKSEVIFIIIKMACHTAPSLITNMMLTRGRLSMTRVEVIGKYNLTK